MLVLVEVDDRVATVTLNRPEARNAISGELHRELDEAVHRPRRPGRRGLHGAHRRRPGLLRRHGPQVARHRAPLGPAGAARAAPLRYVGMLPPHDTPIIGAINGPTVTGGLELAMCCDFLIASERARFADTHARVGAMPGGGMTIRLPQLVGIDRARRMSFTGDYIDAATARDWGLVVEVVPHESLLERARELAATVASIPAEYVRELRRMYDEIGALTGQEAWLAESALVAGSGWRSASTSRACPPSARRSSPGAGRRPRGSTARRREGLRGHGPAPQPARRHRPRPAGRAARLRRAARGRDGARLDGGGAARGRAHRADHRPHQRHPRLHPQPDPARLRGLGHLQAERRAVRARPRAPRSARTSRTATPCPSATTRSPGSATTSARCGRPSRPSPRARRRPTRARTTASPACSRTSTRGPTPRRRCRRSTSAACSGGPARWPAPWRTASSATRPTRTRATCARRACPPWPTAPGRRAGTWAGPGSRPSSARR